MSPHQRHHVLMPRTHESVRSRGKGHLRGHVESGCSSADLKVRRCFWVIQGDPRNHTVLERREREEEELADVPPREKGRGGHGWLCRWRKGPRAQEAGKGKKWIPLGASRRNLALPTSCLSPGETHFRLWASRTNREIISVCGFKPLSLR